MSRKLCAWWWGLGCTLNHGHVHVCANPHGHPGAHVCFCYDRQVRARPPHPDPAEDQW